MPKSLNISKEFLEKELQTKTPKEIATILHCHPEVIRKYARKYSIKYFRIKNINQHFFKKWTPDMAYILGFITADGSINTSYGHYNLRIELSIKDINMLYYIAQHLYPTAKILFYSHKDKRTNKTYKSALLSISSKEIINDLSKFSIFPNKTGKHRINFKIPKQYQRDYIRGFFDGDGCCCIRNLKNRQYLMSSFACQSIHFLNDLLKILPVKSTINKKSKPPNIKFHHHQSLKLRDFMYYENCPCLLRKKNKFYGKKENHSF